MVHRGFFNLDKMKIKKKTAHRATWRQTLVFFLAHFLATCRNRRARMAFKDQMVLGVIECHGRGHGENNRCSMIMVQEHYRMSLPLKVLTVTPLVPALESKRKYFARARSWHTYGRARSWHTVVHRFWRRNTNELGWSSVGQRGHRRSSSNEQLPSENRAHGTACCRVFSSGNGARNNERGGRFYMVLDV